MPGTSKAPRPLSLLQGSVTSPTTATSPVSSTPSPSTSRGPRPLSLTLVGRDGPASPGPATAPLAARQCFSPTSGMTMAGGSGSPAGMSTRRPFPPRRQSSISYRTSGDGIPVSGRGHGRGHVQKNYSVSVRSSYSPDGIEGLGIQLEHGPEKNASGKASSSHVQLPVASVDQPAELLRVIAQKESICLDLRSQLSHHEAELVNLKRRWETIVSRSLPPSAAADTSVYLNSTLLDSAKQTVVFEGIKEGVQGVGRFLAGLSDLPPPLPPNPHHLSQKKALEAKSKRESTSSTSTSGKSSLRLSQSSFTSSYATDDSRSSPALSTTELDECVPSESDPTSQEQEQAVPLSADDTNHVPISASSSSSSVHRRRKSHDASRVSPSQISPISPLQSSIASSPVSPSSSTTQTNKPSPALSSTSTSNGHRKRLSLAALPPSSIPGMTALSAVGALSPLPPLSSIMGHAAKKWEDLQRGQAGAMAAHTRKRASVLLSDVSNSFMTAIAPAPSSARSASENGKMTRSPSTSLLDDDEDMPSFNADPLTELTALQPMHVTSLPPTPAAQPASVTSPPTSHIAYDDDWNW